MYRVDLHLGLVRSAYVEVDAGRGWANERSSTFCCLGGVLSSSCEELLGGISHHPSRSMFAKPTRSVECRALRGIESGSDSARWKMFPWCLFGSRHHLVHHVRETTPNATRPAPPVPPCLRPASFMSALRAWPTNLSTTATNH